MEVTQKEASQAKKLYKALCTLAKLKVKLKSQRLALIQKNKNLRLENAKLKDKLDKALDRLHTLDLRYHTSNSRASQDTYILNRYRENVIKKRRTRVEEIITQQNVKENIAFQMVDREIPFW